MDFPVYSWCSIFDGQVIENWATSWNILVREASYVLLVGGASDGRFVSGKKEAGPGPQDMETETGQATVPLGT